MSKHSLQAYNTFGVKASADQLYFVKSEQEVLQLLAEDLQPDLILGGGSNILLSGRDIPVVFKNNILGKEIIEENDKEALVEIGGGENWHEFVLWSIEKGLGGIENLSLIPGTVGAAPIQNIGAYGVELKNVFHSLDAIHLKNQAKQSFDLLEADFAYRDSYFKRNKGMYFICKVRLSLSKIHQPNLSYGAIEKTLQQKGIQNPTIKEVSDAVIQIRSSKLPDPKRLGNAGSFFKNPIVDKEQFQDLLKAFPNLVYYAIENDQYKIPAGWLIDQSGFKGRREGNVGCYKNQALVIVNHHKATGEEILSWAGKIGEVVKKRYGITLEKEVNII